MTDDLIERLRRYHSHNTTMTFYDRDEVNPDGPEAADRIATQQEAIDELVGLIRECRLADAYAARTGDETRWDRAFHALCRAEKGER